MLMITENTSVRVVCPKLLISRKEPGLQWLIGSPFFPHFTIFSTFRCIHTLENSFSPDFSKESALEDARLMAVDFDLDVLCYAAKDLSVRSAVSNLIIPGLVDQLNSMKKVILPNLLTQHPQVTCKIINVRSGAELPEKCRELALHFKNQGTPIMIGGGVLAYTLVGVDYNEGSGDCAFLILDPHYTGNDEHKKIINGGWCGWKKAVDSKGNNVFLHDKLYNLLPSQRPNLV